MTFDLPPDRADQTLHRIAASLGCSVEELASDDRLADDLLHTQELLTLWNRMSTQASREALLRAARAIVLAQQST